MEQGESGAPIVGLDELIGHIRDGMKLAIPHDFNGMYSGAALSATRSCISSASRPAGSRRTC